MRARHGASGGGWPAGAVGPVWCCSTSFETLLRLDGLRDRFVEIGRPAHELELFFARTVRDGMALTLAGRSRPSPRSPGAALRSPPPDTRSANPWSHVRCAATGFRVLRPLPRHLAAGLEPRGVQHLDPLAVRRRTRQGDGADQSAAGLVHTYVRGACCPAEHPLVARAARVPTTGRAPSADSAPRHRAGGRAWDVHGACGPGWSGPPRGPARRRVARRRRPRPHVVADRLDILVEKLLGRCRGAQAHPIHPRHGLLRAGVPEPPAWVVRRPTLECTMADPATYRPAPGTIPEAPGVYRFCDAHGRVIYVGKAKSLRSRLNSYFADLAILHPRTRQMVTSAAPVQWTVVATEVEALQLEYNWIKEFDPRFNVRYRDDKSYPVLAVTLNEEFPRLHVYRGPRRKGVRYFGPYAHAWAIRETLDLLLRVFPARTCSAGVFKRHGQIGRPCLLGYIDKCSAPCVGRVDRRRAPGHRRGLLRVPLRPDRPHDARAGAEDAAGRRRPGVRAGRPAARRPRRAAPGDGEAGGGARRRHRRRRRGVRRRTSWRPRSRCSTCAAAGSAASAAG